MANGQNEPRVLFASLSAAGAFGGRDPSRPRVWRHSSATTPMRRTRAAASSPPALEEPAHLAGLATGRKSIWTSTPDPRRWKLQRLDAATAWRSHAGLV